MTTLREIRRKIHTVSNIQKITEAMELVAASRLHKAQTKAASSRPYALKLGEILDRLIAASDELHHPLMAVRPVKKTGLIIVAGDRGLCGGYNQNVFTAAEKCLGKFTPDQVELMLVGRKTVDHFKSRKWPISHKLEDWGGKITYHQIEAFTNMVMQAYINGQLDEVWIVHTHFLHMGLREVKTTKFLNIEALPTTKSSSSYIFEPSAPEIFAEILPHYCITKMQSILQESYASELAARIFSMRAASKNAKEMIEKLTLIRNKARQAGITRELIEITSSAESLR